MALEEIKAQISLLLEQMVTSRKTCTRCTRTCARS